MRDVLAGVDALVADGLADPDRLGRDRRLVRRLSDELDRRPRPALPRRDDLPVGERHGDALPDRRHQPAATGRGYEFECDAVGRPGVLPRDLADHLRRRDPDAAAHPASERDIRTTIGQAEALFTVLRSLRRPVRLLRVPEETHELTRSGTPFRRIENLEIVRDWFRHFLVEGKRGLPPLPKVRAGPLSDRLAVRYGVAAIDGRRGRRCRGPTHREPRTASVSRDQSSRPTPGVLPRPRGRGRSHRRHRRSRPRWPPDDDRAGHRRVDRAVVGERAGRRRT